ncbi:hypothetical protein M409DRAFT_21208 [Zasmidium cellare ATCC 36951]|uniref:Uncharacterized protein n=1 Tax=Zasmidium cellare ATCC 36951 TaxID=1080233 RepID=A0A6A6CMI8_ZASCE|nr:uncharacterized protein M409DRAFT_21208 [Zasmidium cellare ATCC 36951]KAF2168457.1 hypothetical protein M409DRAFT_21208 [Zasmidium cellare ATCC 36951]
MSWEVDALVSLLLRELCVAFIILETGCAIGGFSLRRKWWVLGETGYGLGWVELAGTVQLRASKLLGFNDLIFEMKRKVRTEYIRSGLEPSQEQIKSFFGGEAPLVSDDGEERIGCRKDQIMPNRNDLMWMGIGIGLLVWGVALSAIVFLV